MGDTQDLPKINAELLKAIDGKASTPYADEGQWKRKVIDNTGKQYDQRLDLIDGEWKWRSVWTGNYWYDPVVGKESPRFSPSAQALADASALPDFDGATLDKNDQIVKDTPQGRFKFDPGPAGGDVKPQWIPENDTNRDKIFTAPPDFVKGDDGRLYITQDKKKFRVPKDAMKQKDVPYVYSKRAMDTFKELNPDGDYSEQLVSTAPITGKEAWALLATGDTLKPTGKDIDAGLGWKEKLLKRAESDPKARAMVRSRLNEAALQQLRAQMDFVRNADGSLDTEKYSKALAEKKFFGPDLKAMKTHTAQLRTFAGSALSSFVDAAIGDSLSTHRRGLERGISSEDMRSGGTTPEQQRIADMYPDRVDIEAFQKAKAKAESIKNESERAVALFKLSRDYMGDELDLRAWSERMSAAPAFTNIDEAPFFSRIANKAPGAVGSTVGFIAEGALEGAGIGGAAKTVLGKGSLIPLSRAVESAGIKLGPKLTKFVATKNINIPAAVVGINGAFNEAGVEARDTYFNSFLKNMQDGKGYDEANTLASKASFKTYWGNVALLGATEWFLPTFKVIKSLTGTGQTQLAREFAIEGLKEAERRGVRSAFVAGMKTAGAAGLGGLQETGQSVISSVASGEKVDAQAAIDEGVIGAGVELVMGGLGNMRENRLNKSVDGSAAPLGPTTSAATQPLGLPSEQPAAPTDDFTARVAEHRTRLVASPEARRQFTTIPDVVGQMSKEEKSALDVLRRKSVWAQVSDGLAAGMSPEEALAQAEEFSGASKLAVAAQDGADQKALDKIKTDFAAKREAATALLTKFTKYADGLATSRAVRDMELSGKYTPEQIAAIRDQSQKVVAAEQPAAEPTTQPVAQGPVWTDDQLQTAWETYADGHIDVGSKSILHKPSAAALNIAFNEKVDGTIAPIREKADAAGVAKPLVERVIGYVKSASPESLKTLGALYTGSHNLLVKAGVVRDGRINDQMVNNSPNDQVRAARDNIRVVHELKAAGLIDLEMSTSGKGPAWSVSAAPMHSMRDLALADVQSKWNSDHAMKVATEAGFTGKDAEAFRDAFMAFGRGEKGIKEGASELHPTLARTGMEPDLVNANAWSSDKSAAAMNPDEVWDVVTAGKAVMADLMAEVKSGAKPKTWWSSREAVAALVNQKLSDMGKAIRIKDGDVPYLNSTLAKQGLLGYVESAKKFMQLAEDAQDAGGTPADLFAAMGAEQFNVGPEHFRKVQSPRYYFIDTNGDMVSDRGVRRTPISALNDIADRIMAFTDIPSLQMLPDVKELANGLLNAIRTMDKARAIAMMLWHGVDIRSIPNVEEALRRSGRSEESITGFMENSKPIRDKSIIAGVIGSLTGKVMTPGEVKADIEAGENQIATMLPAINNLGIKLAEKALELLETGNIARFNRLRMAALQAAPELAKMNGWIGPRAPIVSRESGGITSQWQAKERVAPTANGVALKDKEGNIIKIPVKGFVEGMTGVLGKIEETDPAYPAMLAFRDDLVTAANTSVGRKAKGTTYTKSGSRITVEPRREHVGKRIGVTAHAVEGSMVNKIMANDASDAALDSAETIVSQSFMRLFMKDVATRFAEKVSTAVEGETFRTPRMASAAAALVRMAAQQAISKMGPVPDGYYRQDGTPDLAKLGHLAVERTLDRLDRGRGANELQEVMVFADELEQATQEAAALVATRSTTYAKVADTRLTDINSKRRKPETEQLETGEGLGVVIRHAQELGADATEAEGVADQSVFNAGDSNSLMERWEAVIELAKTEGNPGLLADKRMEERALLRSAPMAILMQIKDMFYGMPGSDADIKHEFKKALSDWLGTMAMDDKAMTPDDMRYLLSFTPGMTRRDMNSIVDVATKIAAGEKGFNTQYQASRPSEETQTNDVLDEILRSSEAAPPAAEVQTPVAKAVVAEEKKQADTDNKSFKRLLALTDAQKDEAHFMALTSDTAEGAAARRGMAMIPGMVAKLQEMNAKLATLRGAAKNSYAVKRNVLESQLRGVQTEMLRATTRMMAVYADAVGMREDAKNLIERNKETIVDLEVEIDRLSREVKAKEADANNAPSEAIVKLMDKAKTHQSIIASITKALDSIPSLVAKRDALQAKLAASTPGLRSGFVNQVAEVTKTIEDIKSKAMGERLTREQAALKKTMDLMSKAQEKEAAKKKPSIAEYMKAVEKLSVATEKLNKVYADVANAKNVVAGRDMAEGSIDPSAPKNIILLSDRLSSFYRISGNPHADLAIEMIEARMRKLFGKRGETAINEIRAKNAPGARLAESTKRYAAEQGAITNGAVDSVAKTDGEVAAAKVSIAADVLGLDATEPNPVLEPEGVESISNHVYEMSDPQNRSGLRAEGLYRDIRAMVIEAEDLLTPAEKKAIDEAVEAETPGRLSTSDVGKSAVIGGVSLAVYMADPELGRLLMGTELAYYGLHWASMKLADKMGLPQGSTVVDVAKVFISKYGAGAVTKLRGLLSTLSDGMARAIVRAFRTITGSPTGGGLKFDLSESTMADSIPEGTFDGSAVGGEYFTPVRPGATRSEKIATLMHRLNTYNANLKEAALKVLNSGYSMRGKLISGDAIIAEEIVRDMSMDAYTLRHEDPSLDMAWRQLVSSLPSAVFDMALARLEPGANVVVVTGPPASGKTTISDSYAATNDLVVEAQQVNEAASVASALKARGFKPKVVYVFNGDLKSLVLGNVVRAMDIGRWGSLGEIARATKMALNDLVFGAPGGTNAEFVNTQDRGVYENKKDSTVGKFIIEGITGEKFKDRNFDAGEMGTMSRLQDALDHAVSEAWLEALDKVKDGYSIVDNGVTRRIEYNERIAEKIADTAPTREGRIEFRPGGSLVEGLRQAGRATERGSLVTVESRTSDVHPLPPVGGELQADQVDDISADRLAKSANRIAESVYVASVGGNPELELRAVNNVMNELRGMMRYVARKIDTTRAGDPLGNMQIPGVEGVEHQEHRGWTHTGAFFRMLGHRALWALRDPNFNKIYKATNDAVDSRSIMAAQTLDMRNRLSDLQHKSPAQYNNLTQAIFHQTILERRMTIDEATRTFGLDQTAADMLNEIGTYYNGTQEQQERGELGGEKSVIYDAIAGFIRHQVTSNLQEMNKIDAKVYGKEGTKEEAADDERLAQLEQENLGLNGDLEKYKNVLLKNPFYFPLWRFGDTKLDIFRHVDDEGNKLKTPERIGTYFLEATDNNPTTAQIARAHDEMLGQYALNLYKDYVDSMREAKAEPTRTIEEFRQIAKNLWNSGGITGNESGVLMRDASGKRTDYTKSVNDAHYTDMVKRAKQGGAIISGALLKDILSQNSTLNKEQRDSVMKDLDYLIGRRTLEQSMSDQRSGIAGYNMDIKRVIGDHAFMIGSKISSLKNLPAIYDGMAALKGDEYSGIDRQDAQNYVMNALSPAWGEKMETFSSYARAMVFYSTLAFKPSFGIVNALTQKAITTSVYLKSKYDGDVRPLSAGASIAGRLIFEIAGIGNSLHAMSDTKLADTLNKIITKDAIVGAVSDKDSADRIATQLRAILTDAVRSGIFKETLTSFMAGTDGISIKRFVESNVATRTTWNWTRDMAMYASEKSEGYNRIRDFVAQSIYSLDNGKNRGTIEILPQAGVKSIKPRMILNDYNTLVLKTREEMKRDGIHSEYDDGFERALNIEVLKKIRLEAEHTTALVNFGSNAANIEGAFRSPAGRLFVALRLFPVRTLGVWAESARMAHALGRSEGKTTFDSVLRHGLPVLKTCAFLLAIGGAMSLPGEETALDAISEIINSMRDQGGIDLSRQWRNAYRDAIASVAKTASKAAGKDEKAAEDVGAWAGTVAADNGILGLVGIGIGPQVGMGDMTRFKPGSSVPEKAATLVGGVAGSKAFEAIDAFSMGGPVAAAKKLLTPGGLLQPTNAIMEPYIDPKLAKVYGEEGSADLRYTPMETATALVGISPVRKSVLGEQKSMDREDLVASDDAARRFAKQFLDAKTDADRDRAIASLQEYATRMIDQGRPGAVPNSRKIKSFFGLKSPSIAIERSGIVNNPNF